MPGRFHDRFAYWRALLHGEAAAILTVTGLAAAALALYFLQASHARQPAQRVDAVVLSFGMTAHHKRDWPVAVVRTADGRTHNLVAYPSDLRGCTVGAPIRLVRRGGLLQIDPRGCRVE